MFDDYHAWRKVADTALPQNILGYIIQFCLSPLRADPFTLTPYDQPKELAKCGKDNGRRAFLPDIPEREGPCPEMLKWMAPHRQSSQFANADMHKVGPPICQEACYLLPLMRVASSSTKLLLNLLRSSNPKWLSEHQYWNNRVMLSFSTIPSQFPIQSRKMSSGRSRTYTGELEAAIILYTQYFRRWTASKLSRRNGARG